MKVLRWIPYAETLLKNGANLLKRAFAGYEIYRVGGDEFVILCPDITEQSLSVHTAFLRQLCDETSEIRFAIGTGFFTGQFDMDETLHIADEQMYQDKEEHYRQNPEKNRRKKTKYPVYPKRNTGYFRLSKTYGG